MLRKILIFILPEWTFEFLCFVYEKQITWIKKDKIMQKQHFVENKTQIRQYVSQNAVSFLTADI